MLDEEACFPNFNFIPTVTEKMSMLVVEYFFTFNDDKDTSDEKFCSKISDSAMNFYLFELVEKLDW